jgi:hypothetical protein
VQLRDLVLAAFHAYICPMDELNRRDLQIGAGDLDPGEETLRLCALIEDPLDRAFFQGMAFARLRREQEARCN